MVQTNQTNVSFCVFNQGSFFTFQLCSTFKSKKKTDFQLRVNFKSYYEIMMGGGNHLAGFLSRPHHNCVVLELSPFSFHLSLQACHERRAAGSAQISLFKSVWVPSASLLEVGGVIYNHSVACGLRALYSVSCSDLCQLIQLHSFCLLMTVSCLDLCILCFIVTTY